MEILNSYNIFRGAVIRERQTGVDWTVEEPHARWDGWKIHSGSTYRLIFTDQMKQYSILDLSEAN
jgi:hypothetical protein